MFNDFIQEILGNPRYKFAILVVLSLLTVFFVYSGDSSMIQSYLPEFLATSSVIGSVIADSNLAETPPVDVNIDMLAPF
jgi:hypothetical protein